MKQKMITVLFFLLEMSASFFAWRSVSHAIFFPEASDFLMPSIFFSLLVVLLLVSVVLFTNWIFRVAIVAFAILPMFLFLVSLPMIIVGIISGALLCRSLQVVDRELSEHLRVRFFSSARMVVFFLSLSLSLAIATFYLGLIESLPPEKLLPRFSFADGVGRHALEIAGKLNPGLATLAEESVSVDEFLLGLMPVGDDGKSGMDISQDATYDGAPSRSVALQDAAKSLGISGPDMSRLLQGVTATDQDFEKTIFLQEGRRRIGTILGRDVSGDERAQDVLTEAINAKIFSAFSVAGAEGTSVGMLRFVMALLLFISLLSLGSIFGIVWTAVAALIFWVLQGAGIVKIERVMVEAERIVFTD